MNRNGPLLEGRNLLFRRVSGRSPKTILDNISLTLSRGEILHLQGPSGSGKSTLLWVLVRMLPLDAGELVLDGKPAAEWPPTLWRTRIALVLQKHSMIAGTVRDNLVMPWRLKVRSGSGQSTAAASLPNDEQLRRELDNVALSDVDLDTDAAKLSVGQTARVSLVRTLLTGPDCLLLDEPCAALDDASSSHVMARIQSFIDTNGAVLLAGHNSLTTDCRILRLEKGRLREEAP